MPNDAQRVECLYGRQAKATTIITWNMHGLFTIIPLSLDYSCIAIMTNAQSRSLTREE